MGLEKLFTGAIGDVVDSVGSAIDKIFTNDEERLAMKNKLEEIKMDASLKSLQVANEYEAEITKRNDSDQVHGNFLTKSARPIFLYWIMFIITVMIFGGLFDKTIDPSYVDLVQILALTAVTFFFGSKGMEIYKHGRQI